MNPIMDETPGKDLTGQKKSYVKPEVTTFGSVAKLTLGTTGSVADTIGGGHHHSA